MPFVVGDPINQRVQGIESSLDDLTLRDGRRLHLELGGAVVKTPTLKRTIGGGTNIDLQIHDRDLGFLNASLLAERWDAELDGLHFRYIGADLRDDGIGLTLKDRDIAVLEEQTEHLAAYRKDMTRARFIINAVKSVRPNAKITCPQIDEIPPVETEKQGKKAAEDAKANKGKGIGDAKHLTVKGEKATPEQIEIGERAARAIGSRNSPFRMGVATFVSLIVESGLGLFSRNYMQMTPGTEAASKYSATVIEEAVSGFLLGYIGGEGGAIAYFHSHPDAEPFEIAQAVQKSGAGLASNGQANYGPWVGEAREWVEAFEGGEFSAAGASREVVEPYKFELCAEEEGEKADANWWEGIKRLAKEVNWRAFWVAGRFFFIDEIELFRQAVRLAIDRETPGITSVTGKFRHNRPGTDLTIEAFASKWKVPPGGVITLADYGPFSIGFGDAPLEKGEVGISGNRAAATGVGRARYLLESIESPLRDREVSELRKVRCNFRKPTAPLPEPAANRKTVTSKGSSVAADGEMPPSVAKAIEEADRIDAAGWAYSSPGARGTPPPSNGPYDCSGVTSYISFVICGAPGSSLSSQELSEIFEAGEGQWFTIYSHGPNGPTGHALSHIKKADGVWWFFGTSSSNPGGGAGWIPESEYDAGYLSAFAKRHPKGF